MERINLNVPSSVRRRLRQVAKQLEVTEAEAARRLLTGALERVERQDLYRRMAHGYTPELRARDLAIADAFERFDG